MGLPGIAGPALGWCPTSDDRVTETSGVLCVCSPETTRGQGAAAVWASCSGSGSTPRTPRAVRLAHMGREAVRLPSPHALDLRGRAPAGPGCPRGEGPSSRTGRSEVGARHSLRRGSHPACEQTHIQACIGKELPVENPELEEVYR